MRFKKILKLFFVCVLCCHMSGVAAMDDCFFMEDNELFGNGGEYDIFNNEDVNAILDTTIFKVGEQVSPKEVVAALVEISVVKLLEEDLFLSTASLNKRSLVTYPLFLCDKDYALKWDIGVNLFYNQTTRMNFTYDSSCLFCYLGLLQPNLIDKINGAIDKIREILGQDFDFDTIGTLSLFKHATCNERRVGIMLQGLREYRDVRFHFKFPFYWRERNYYLTPAEQEEIEREFGALDPDQQEEFQAEHLISDRLGFGDFRFEVDFPVGRQKKGFYWRAGVLTTLPINIAIIDGLMGSVYKKCQSRPSFSFEELFSLATDPETRPEAEKIAEDFFLCALDCMSNTFLDTTLGRDRHLGVGALFRSKVPFSTLIKKSWAEQVFYKGNITFEYLFPYMKCRNFIECPDIQAFLDRHFEDYDDEELVDEITEARARDDLEFLEEKFVDKFFPYVYMTKVRPRIELTWSNKLSYEPPSKIFGLHLGLDFWIKSGERLSNVSASCERKKRLDYCKATRGLAYQWRGLGEFIFRVKRQTKDLYLSLNIDGAFASKGIGKDFMVTFNIESNF